MLAEVIFTLIRQRKADFKMDDTKKSFLAKTGEFIRKYALLLTIIAGVLALASLFLPIIKYEIREAVYDIATKEKVTKIDYLFSVGLVQYFTNGLAHNYTIFITLGFILLGILFTFICKFKQDFRPIAGIMFLLAICMFLLAKEFFKSDQDAIMETYKVVGGLDYDDATQYFYVEYHDTFLSWGSKLGIFFCSVSFGLITLSNQSATTRQIAEEGVLLSLAFVLNLIKIPVGATGGSINFQMLPLMIIALRHGPSHGFISSGIVYGLLTCLTDGYGFACYPFDYLIGFGSVAVMGLFRKHIFSDEQEGYNFKGLLCIFIAGILSTCIRFVGSSASSIIVYGYDLKGALAYNVLYIPLSGLAATIAFMALYSPLIRINRMYPVKSI